MSTTLDLLLEIFTWVGFGGSLALVVVAIGLWAADGTWLAADAIIDRESDTTGEKTVVRWIDADGDANEAVVEGADATALAGRDAAEIWYRYGWRGRVRLTRRPPALRRIVLAAAGMLSLGILCLVASWLLYFTRA